MSNKHKSKRIDEKSFFIRKCKRWIIAFFLILIAIYVLIYLCFMQNGFLPTGVGLNKMDWLTFLGTYLSFSGTIIISVIAILQGQFFEKNSSRRSDLDHKKAIQPIISSQIIRMNGTVGNKCDVFSLKDLDSVQSHNNFTLEIENAGLYPINNVIVFETYLRPVLKPNEKVIIQCAYTGSPDLLECKDDIIELKETHYERSDIGIPKNLKIFYDDIDGNEMVKVFSLKTIKGKNYYSLVETHEKN